MLSLVTKSFHLTHSNHADRPHHNSKKLFTGIHIYLKFSLSNWAVLCIVFGRSRSKGQGKRKPSFLFCQSLLSAWWHGLQAPFNHVCPFPLLIPSLLPYTAPRSRSCLEAQTLLQLCQLTWVLFENGSHRRCRIFIWAPLLENYSGTRFLFSSFGTSRDDT